jgi:Replication-relaxation
VSAIPDSYTAAHRYDGAIIQRQRCDDPDPVALRQRDLGIVRDVWRYHFLTTEQIRELWWPTKTPQAARRRLVKLFRGGYLERFRPYSPRGSYEWTYYLAAHGHRLLRQLGAIEPDARFKPRDVFDYGRALHDVQVNAWVLAYRRLLGTSLIDWQGEHQITPPRGTRNGQRTFDEGWSIEGLRDPQPRPVVPDAALRIADDGGEGARSFLLEYDRTSRTDKNFDKFRRYDNLVTTWWRNTKLADHSEPPYVVFICQDEAQRDDFLARADQELTGHRWHPNHPAAPHQYTGRRHILFCDERDIHHRHLEARRLAPYPPGHPSRTDKNGRVRRVNLPLPTTVREAAPKREGRVVAA